MEANHGRARESNYEQRCSECQRVFDSHRCDADTCGGRCRKRKQRRLSRRSRLGQSGPLRSSQLGPMPVHSTDPKSGKTAKAAIPRSKTGGGSQSQPL